MTTTPQDNFIQEAVREFEAIAKCPTYNCDSNGSIANQISEDEWEQQQCQYCYEVLMPMKEKFRQSLEAQKSHIKETLLAGGLAENIASHLMQDGVSNDFGYVDGYNTARKEDRALINNI